MELDLKDKVALVTGTGSQIGFGKGIALALARDGCNVICTDKDFEGARQTAAEVKFSGRKTVALKAELTIKAEVDTMVNKGLAEFGRIDILVNDAGISSPLQPFVISQEADWDLDLNVNYKGTLYCTQAVLPQMLERKSGKIINISSGVTINGLANNSTYAAAKAAVLIFSKSLALELGPSGINVYIICPSLGNTNFPIASKAPPQFIERLKQLEAEGKTTTPQDMGNAVAYLASDVSKRMNGQVLYI